MFVGSTCVHNFSIFWNIVYICYIGLYLPWHSRVFSFFHLSTLYAPCILENHFHGAQRCSNGLTFHLPSCFSVNNNCPDNVSFVGLIATSSDYLLQHSIFSTSCSSTRHYHFTPISHTLYLPLTSLTAPPPPPVTSFLLHYFSPAVLAS